MYCLPIQVYTFRQKKCGVAGEKRGETQQRPTTRSTHTTYYNTKPISTKKTNTRRPHTHHMFPPSRYKKTTPRTQKKRAKCAILRAKYIF